MFYTTTGFWGFVASILGVIGTLTFLWSPHSLAEMSLRALQTKYHRGPEEHFPGRYLRFLAIALVFLLLSAVLKGDWVLFLSRAPIYVASLFAIACIFEDDGIFEWHEHRRSVQFLLALVTVLTAVAAFKDQLQSVPYLVRGVDCMVLGSTVLFIVCGQIPEIHITVHNRKSGKSKSQNGAVMMWRCVGLTAFIVRYAILGDWAYCANFALSALCELVLVYLHISWSWAAPIAPPEEEVVE